jgi:hypothetical protein
MVQEIEYINDDDFFNFNRDETPEQRYGRVRRWVAAQLKEPRDANPA